MFEDQRVSAERPDQPTEPAAAQPPPAAVPDPPRPKRPRRFDGLALVLVGALIGGSVGFGAAHAITPQLLAPAARPASADARTADTVDQAAIKDVLRRANQAQAEAFAKQDPTLMRPTSTDAHYQELVSVNNDLAAGGVRRIDLLDIRFGAIAVQGDHATATTIETWRSTYRDGTTDQRTDQNDYSLVRAADGWKIDSNSQPDSGTGVAPTQPQVPGDTTVRSSSRNWSGYVATGATYTAVSATWTVPTPDPTVTGTDATWVGIGGVGSTDLIQAGTGATVAADGTVTYEAWTETLPQSTRTVGLAIHGGDTVSVRIAEESSGLWRVTIENGTTGQSYATTLRYASSHVSAEWIEEAPSIGRGIAPLDAFGTVGFRSAATVANGATTSLAAAGAKPVTMTNAVGQALAVPSAIGADGGSFTVSRTKAASGGLTPGRRRG